MPPNGMPSDLFVSRAAKFEAMRSPRAAITSNEFHVVMRDASATRKDDHLYRGSLPRRRRAVVRRRVEGWKAKVLRRPDGKLQIWPAWGQSPFSRITAATVAAAEELHRAAGGEIQSLGRAFDDSLRKEVRARTSGLGVDFYLWTQQLATSTNGAAVTWFRGRGARLETFAASLSTRAGHLTTLLLRRAVRGRLRDARVALVAATVEGRVTPTLLPAREHARERRRGQRHMLGRCGVLVGGHRSFGRARSDEQARYERS